jgi:hypothetical protein
MPSDLDEPTREQPPKGSVGDRDDRDVLGGKLIKPRRSVLDSSRFGDRRVLPAQAKQSRSSTDGNGPGEKWKTKAAQRGSLEIELA